jgi:Ran GTPase-activating protein (RanGAP) involved in mRNA processing and transport
MYLKQQKKSIMKKKLRELAESDSKKADRKPKRLMTNLKEQKGLERKGAKFSEYEEDVVVDEIEEHKDVYYTRSGEPISERSQEKTSREKEEEKEENVDHHSKRKDVEGGNYKRKR